eukprot:7404475-Ditylum_brightwellii.AAC.1
MELVVVSQVVDMLYFTIDGPNTTIAKDALKMIGVGPSTDEHLNPIKGLALLAAESQQHIEDEIVQHDIQASGSFEDFSID